MRVEYIVISFILALVVLLISISLLTGVVPSFESVLRLFQR